MKNYLTKAIAYTIVFTSMYNCTVEPVDNLQTQTIQQDSLLDVSSQTDTCTGISPKARITNNGTIPFDYEIFDSTGSLIAGIYGIAPGTVSTWTDFSEGDIIFVVENNSVSDQKVVHTMNDCMELNMEIDANNILTDTQPQQASN